MLKIDNRFFLYNNTAIIANKFINFSLNKHTMLINLANYYYKFREHKNHNVFFQFPDSAEKWERVAGMFQEKWHFPHCLGAMDGKHIDIVPPGNNGSFYFNYKGRHSMVLLAIVDATYRFLLVDFGTNGRISDGGVLSNTTFHERLLSNNLNIPDPSNVSDNFKQIPYVFVADDAFPLATNIMKPFRQAQLDSASKEIFNYRLSRARHVVENAFGILASRFRIFHTQINLEPKNTSKVVMATCVLHNFLMQQQPTTYYVHPNNTYQENYDGEVICTAPAWIPPNRT